MAEPIPEALRIEVAERSRLEIEWADGATTTFTAPEIRALCPCAACRELPPSARTASAHEAATIEAAALVGSYAINFTFGPDGHSAGIYPFGELRRVQSD